MKGYHSNSKLVFAYQDREDQAAATNKQLDSNAIQSSVIRIVEPADSPAEGVMTHPEYDSTTAVGLEKHSMDSLVGVAVSKILRTNQAGDTSILNTSNTVRSISSLRTANFTKVFDIQLSSGLNDTLDVASGTNGTILYKAVIELYFSSGETEDLILNLKGPSRLVFTIRPEDITITDPFTLIPINPDPLDGTFISYSTSKAYRRLTERRNVANNTGTQRNLYSIGYPGYTTFSQPFGIIADNAVGIESIQFTGGPQWLPEGFASSKTSHLTWFSGYEDMTRMRIPTWEDTKLNTYEQYESTIESGSPVALYNLFGIVAPIIDYDTDLNTSDTDFGLGKEYKFRAYPELPELTPLWGQSYGWFSSLNSGDIVSPQGLTVVSQTSQNFGVPPIFRESSQIPNQGIDDPQLFWGAFTGESSSQDGVLLNPIFGTLTPQNSDVISTDPIAVRKSRLLYGPDGKIPGTSVNTADIFAQDVFLNEGFAVQYNLSSVRNNFCFWPTNTLPSVDSSLNYGGVGVIPTNIGANFFYAGCAGQSGDAYMPVFKGIIRANKVIRYANEENLGSLSSSIANLAEQSFGSEFSVLDMRTFQYAGVGAPTEAGGFGLNRFNGIDLVSNLVFTGHTYPTKALGSLSDTQSQHIPQITGSVGQMALYRLGHSALRGVGSELTPNGIGLQAQDIVFLNSAIVPDPYNKKVGRNSDPSGTYPYPYTRNHPIGHPLGNKQPGPFIGIEQHYNSTSTSFQGEPMPYIFTSRPFHGDLGETAATPIPPYPYAPTNFEEVGHQASYKNYAGPTDTNGYFSGNVSADGITPSIGLGKNLTIPIYPRAEDEFLFITGTDNCLKGMQSSVKLIGGGDNNLTTSLGNGAVKIVYNLLFQNTCAAEFSTSAGSKVTTGATVADRINEVLQIFPHIEYRPLAMLSATADNPLAYKTIVQDDEDVDDINITFTNGVYTLEIIIESDAQDVIFTGGADTPVPYADVWGDLPYPTTISTDSYTVNGLPFTTRYSSVEGETEYATHKASYITIASSSSWDTFEQSQGIIQSTGTSATEFAYHTPFIVFNDPVAEDEVNPVIFGCTDPAADNYDAAATNDDGSCTDCTTEVVVGPWTLESVGLHDGNAGMRVGVINPLGYTGGYLYGQMPQNSAIGINQLSTWFSQAPVGSIYNSTGAKYGGAFVSNNNYFGQAAVANLSVGAAMIGVNALMTVLTYLENQYNENHTAWRLKIKPLSDVLIDLGLDFEGSYSTSNPIPAELEAVTPIYNQLANGGSITDPEWNDILVPGSPISGLNTGAPYILELSLEPQNTGPECEILNSGEHVILGLMWATFCACGIPGNDYMYTAMNGALYDWQANLSTAFPIISPNGTYCPEGQPDNLFGDSAYPLSICFQPDAELSDCDQYWLYCIQSSQVDCMNPEDLFTLDDAYQVGDNGAYYYDYINGFITVNVEGVYNANVNGFVWDPNIEYIVTVSNGTTYFASQDQTDSIAPAEANIFQNSFDGIVESGVYTITFTFFAPYDENFSDPDFPDNNCSFTEEVIFDTPDQNCPEVITGCTDETADTYDPTATYDDGTCESEDPCTDILLNPSLSVTLTSTPSDSQCITDTIIVNGASYNSTVIVPDNNGSITANITYTAADSGTGVNNFALLILPNPPTGGVNVNTVVDSVGIMFSSGQVPTVDSLPGGITGIGYWSEIFQVTGATASFTYTQNFLPPGNYYVIAVVNPSVEGLATCGEGAFVALLEQVLETNVGLNDPDNPCPEPCIGTDCPDYVLDCTDPAADNYNPDATFDDGSCEYTETFCETNPNDDLCIDCSDLAAIGQGARIVSLVPEETICDPVTGSDGYCTDPNACNYNPDAALDESNNLICDYCTCIEDPTDPDCYQDDDCDPQLDPNCGEPEPECPDPSNPACNPTIFDPCPVGECGPPDDPCIILGNCEGDPNDPDDDGDTFEDVISTVEVTCPPDIETADGSDLNFDDVLLQAFQCMSQEGQKMLFRMKSGAYYDDTDILKLSLIAYLFNGGLNKVQLPCLFNCNYETAATSKIYDCQTQWAATGARYYNSVDTYQRGDIVLYYYMQGNKVTRNYYIATREIQPIDLHPRYAASGWHRCSSVTVRTADKNSIATGNEEYLQVMWEFMTRFCTQCEVVSNPTASQDVNNVDPKVLKNYIDPKTSNNNFHGNSGILGEDGEEIIF